jgi:hypothetical protein
VHDNPEVTEGEQEAAQEGRRQDEKPMRHPEHDDPETQRRRAHDEDD